MIATLTTISIAVPVSIRAYWTQCSYLLFLYCTAYHWCAGRPTAHLPSDEDCIRRLIGDERHLTNQEARFPLWPPDFSARVALSLGGRCLPCCVVDASHTHTPKYDGNQIRCGIA